MKSHEDIDRRGLVLALEIVARIDADPLRAGLESARATCRHWRRVAPSPAVEEWAGLLDGSWEEVRSVLLRDDQEGRRLRQNSPFCSVLTPHERWEIYRRCGRESQAA